MKTCEICYKKKDDVKKTLIQYPDGEGKKTYIKEICLGCQLKMALFGAYTKVLSKV